ncbi:CoxG family protein [Amycolatopsis jejuensis]|uniref:CoxG family protein n=1 Tax=Amycolatopsis jejuensis TaxID=330084 RepID=UPI00052671D2|nr:SRPBCC domain-containing protein [Amycolatopsis jejuensis]
MNITGTREFAAPPDALWRALTDPQSVAGILPAAHDFQVEDDGRWRVQVVVPLGLGTLPLALTITPEVLAPYREVRYTARGRGTGVLIEVTAELRIASAATGSHLSWEASALLRGAVASIGRHVLDPMVEYQISGFLETLDGHPRATAAG